MNNQNNSFSYTYSAKEQAEVELIRKKYLPKEEDKLEQLRRMDRAPMQKAQTMALTLGILGSLIMGSGMSLIMTELGAWLGQLAFVIGIVIGVVGLGMMGLAFPVYNGILRKEQEKVAPEILRLSEELLK